MRRSRFISLAFLVALAIDMSATAHGNEDSQIEQLLRGAEALPGISAQATSLDLSAYTAATHDVVGKTAVAHSLSELEVKTVDEPSSPACTVNRSAVKAVSAISDLAGEYILSYESYSTFSTDGGNLVTIAAIDGTDSISITNFWETGAVVNAKVDISAMTITIPNQVIGYDDTYGNYDIACFDASNYAVDRSTEITGTISADGTITLSSRWGVFVASTTSINYYFGIYDGATFDTVNGTMTFKAYYLGSVGTYQSKVAVVQDSENCVKVKNFYGQGVTIDITLYANKTATVESQYVYTSSYGDVYTSGATFGSDYSLTDIFSTITCDTATDLRTISWGNWTLVSGYYYFLVGLDCQIETDFDITYPTAVELTLDGDGTESNPYKIATAANWNNLAEYVAAMLDPMTGKYVEITADLDFTETGITAIGYDGSTNFDGDLNGNSHTLKGITVSLTSTYSAPLFYVTGENASIHDFVVEGTVKTSKSYTSTVVGQLYGTIYNVTSNASLTATSSNLCSAGIVGSAEARTTITNCCYGGVYSSVGYYASGVVGYVKGATIVSGCSFTGELTSTLSYAAGIAGYVYNATVTGCTSQGTITSSSDYSSGVVGYIIYGDVTGCVNRSTISANYSKSGGVVGYASHCCVTDCTNEGTITGDYGYYGGLVSLSKGSSITGCVNKGEIKSTYTSYSYNGGVIAYADSASVISNCSNYADLTLSGSYTGGVAGLCRNATITGCCNYGAITATKNTVGGVVGIIGNYCEASGCVNYGTVITTGTTCGGVIGSAFSNSTVTGCYNDSTGSVSISGMNSGGVVGSISSQATVTGCANYGTVSLGSTNNGGVIGSCSSSYVYDCANYGTVTASANYGGGVVGYTASSSEVTGCHNDGSFVTSGSYSGGVVGWCSKGCSFDSCYNIGAVTYTGTSDKCYLAGVYGYCYYGKYSNSYNSGSITSTNTGVGGMAGVMAYLNSSSSTSDSIFVITGCYNTTAIGGVSYTGGIYCYGASSTKVEMTDCHNYATVTGNSASGAYTGGLGAAYFGNGSTYTDCSNSGTINSGSSRAGGLFSTYSGSKSTFTSSGGVTITRCYNTGDIVSAGSHTGGLLGYQYLYTTIDSCYNTGDVSGTLYVGGITGYISGEGGSSISNTYNSGDVTGTNYYIGGLFGYSSSRETIASCFNTGNVTASVSHAGGLAGMGNAAFSDVYNMGSVTAPNYSGGLIALPTAGNTTINRAYNAGCVTATADSASVGNILGVSTSNESYWSSGNSVVDTYFLADNGTSESDTAGTALTRAQLAALELGDNWTAGDKYTYPRIATVADNDYAVAYAAAVIPADENTLDNVTTHFYVGNPDGVTWTASPDVINFSDNTAAFTETYTGTLIVTATAGDCSVSTELTCNVEIDGINSITDDTRKAVDEEFYTISGTRVAKPNEDTKAIYIVVKTYDDGTTEVAKETR